MNDLEDENIWEADLMIEDFERYIQMWVIK